MKKTMLLHGLLISTLIWTCKDPASITAQPNCEVEDNRLAGCIYERDDSLTIEKLLAQAKTLRPEDNRMLFFGKAFIGVPYVAHTLEKGDEETLVINTKELDCTTFIETCTALTLADSRNIRTFTGYCELLRKLRYRQGILNGYPSRLHYFTQWVSDNESMGLVEDIHPKGKPFIGTQPISLHYMSQHPDKYARLARHPEYIDEIRKQEEAANGKVVTYIPKNLLNGTREELAEIKDGDILSMQTNKDGLDCTHLGLAYWKNGKLHLLNASSIHKAVWIDPVSLYNYCKKNKTTIGIRVVRVTSKKSK